MTEHGRAPFALAVALLLAACGEGPDPGADAAPDQNASIRRDMARDRPARHDVPDGGGRDGQGDVDILTDAATDPDVTAMDSRFGEDLGGLDGTGCTSEGSDCPLGMFAGTCQGGRCVCPTGGCFAELELPPYLPQRGELPEARITAGPDGNLWFTRHTDPPAIGRITPAGEITLFPTGAQPLGIATGPDGNLWFTEPSDGQIGRITPAGVITEFPTLTADSQPWFITAGPDGNLWFTEMGANNIGRITPAGEVSEFPVTTAASQPYGIVAGPDGNLWFTEFGDPLSPSTHRLGRMTPDGELTELFVAESGALPTDIAAGPDGNLWFVQTNTDRIGRMTPDGMATDFTSLPTTGATGYGITSGPDGNLWFTSGGLGRITPDGQVTFYPHGAAGTLYSSITTGPDGNLWFRDITGNRIVVFKL